MAYAEGDPNPWGKCECEIRASAEDILIRLWENEGGAWDYNHRVHISTDVRHSPHLASYGFEEQLPYGLPPLQMHFKFMWQALSRSQLAEFAQTVPLLS